MRSATPRRALAPRVFAQLCTRVTAVAVVFNVCNVLGWFCLAVRDPRARRAHPFI